MNKEGKLVLIGIFLIFVILLSFTVSAGFFDWLKKITGEATKTAVLNVTVGAGTAPQLVNVWNNTISATTLTEGPTNTTISINFTAYDADGFLNLDDSKAWVNVTKSGETTRFNYTCIQKNDFDTNYVNYSCEVSMQWYDGDGTWAINASITDLSGNNATNYSTVFTINSNIALVIGPAILSWGSINAGSTNQTPSDFMIMNNTGNQDITMNNTKINATDLMGETTTTQGLWAGNFTVSNNSAGTTECDYPFIAANATSSDTASNMSVVSGIFATIYGANLSRGDFTANNGIAGQEQLYFCLIKAGAEISAQSYSTSQKGAWTIQVT